MTIDAAFHTITVVARRFVLNPFGSSVPCRRWAPSPKRGEARLLDEVLDPRCHLRHVFECSEVISLRSNRR